MEEKIVPPNLESETAKKHWEELTKLNADRKIATAIDDVWEGLPDEVVERLEIERKSDLANSIVAEEIKMIGDTLISPAEHKALTQEAEVRQRNLPTFRKK